MWQNLFEWGCSLRKKKYRQKILFFLFERNEYGRATANLHDGVQVGPGSFGCMFPTRRTGNLWNEWGDGQHFVYMNAIHHRDCFLINDIQCDGKRDRASTKAYFEKAKQGPIAGALQTDRFWPCPFTWRHKYRGGIDCKTVKLLSYCMYVGISVHILTWLKISILP